MNTSHLITVVFWLNLLLVMCWQAILISAVKVFVVVVVFFFFLSYVSLAFVCFPGH